MSWHSMNVGNSTCAGSATSDRSRETFKVENIETQFKVGSKRYEFEDWCEDVLGLPPEAIDDIQSRQGA